MRASRMFWTVLLTLVLTVGVFASPQEKSPGKQKAPAPLSAVGARLDVLKRGLATESDCMKELTQQMVDMLFSLAEPGFQEFETKKYCTQILRTNGFTIEENVAGMPTGWTARWGSGKPVIALGSDVDSLLGTSQKPGVPHREPFIEGAPGHGEGHNTGIPLSITSALALKKVMEREKVAGTIVVWPGIAEELLGGKAQFTKAGVFKDVDVCLFSHIASGMGVSWGDASGTGAVSVEYTFTGQSAHAGAAPWMGRSALDAVELMDVGWNFRREHLRLSQRSHYVITDGGGQPNVVPPTASVWYYFREIDYPHISLMWETGDAIAKGAAMMAGVELQPTKVMGSGWPHHFNKVVAETTWANIQKIGLPQWSDEDQQLAKALQKELKNPAADGLRMKLRDTLQGPVTDNYGGGSDDIGDVSWAVPTITLRYPANIQAGPGHNWANAISMATPIAHKGVIAGAKVQAMTMLDLLLHPELVEKAWDYFKNVQNKDTKYQTFIRPGDKPAVWLNKKIMEEYRPRMKALYYDADKFPTYLEQLGIKYPTVRAGAASSDGK